MAFGTLSNRLVVQRLRHSTPHTPDGRLIPPVRIDEDGNKGLFRLSMLDDDRIAYADDEALLVGVLLGEPHEYMAADDQDRFVMRWVWLAKTAIVIQALVASHLSVESLTAGERDMIFAPPHLRRELVPAFWSGQVPLVLLRTDLRDGTQDPADAPRPTCLRCGDSMCPHIIVLDQTTDWSMLRTLDDCGWITMAYALTE